MSQPSSVDTDTEQPHSNADSNGAASDVETNAEKKLEVNGASAQPDGDQEPPRTATGFLWVLIIVATLSSTFLYAMDNTITATVQPAIVREFGSLEKLSWISVAFLVGAASTNLFWGSIYAAFSAKWAYIGTFILFLAGSALCGAAPNMDALIVGRALCGFGGMGMYTGVLTLLSVQTTEKERPLYMGMTGISWGTGTVLGPIIGGAFTESSASWRWAFYLNLVVGGVFAPVYVFLLPRKDPRPGVKIWTRLAEIDWIGAVLLCGTLLTILMAVSFGGTLFAWDSGSVIALFVVSVVLLIIFITQQVFCFCTTQARRLLPIEFFGSRPMLVQFILTGAAGTATFIPLYFIPLYFQFVLQDDAFQSAVRVLPFVAFMVAFCVGQGYAVTAMGYYMPWFLLAGICDTAGSALLYTVDENTPLANVYGYSILLGVGAGSTIQASFAIVQVKNPPEKIPQAIGFCAMAQLLGPAAMLSVANAIFVNQATDTVQDLLPAVSRGEIQGLISGASQTITKTLSPAVLGRVISLIVDAMSNAFILNLIGGAITLILAFTMKFNDKLFDTSSKKKSEAESDA